MVHKAMSSKKVLTKAKKYNARLPRTKRSY